MNKTDPSTPVPASPEKGNIVALPAKVAEPRASEKIIAFVKDHPAIAIAGGVAIGLAVSALLPRRFGRRAAHRNLVDRAIDFAEATGAAGVVLGRKAGDKAHDLGIDARKQAYKLAKRAERNSDRAAVNLEKCGLAALATASAFGQAAARKASRVAEAAADGANRLGDAAAAGSSKALHAAEDLAKRAKK